MHLCERRQHATENTKGMPQTRMPKHYDRPQRILQRASRGRMAQLQTRTEQASARIWEQVGESQVAHSEA